MLKSYSKITIITLLVFVVLQCSPKIISCGSFFNDTEASESNFIAQNLDLKITNTTFSNLTPAKNAVKSITITNSGKLGVKYNISTNNFSNYISLCEEINIKAFLNSNLLYDGPLNLFSLNNFNLDPQESDTIYLETYLTCNNRCDLYDKECDFNIIINSWQNDFSNPGEGFYDNEVVTNILQTKLEGVVLNEILADPDGLDDAFMPNGEWIELYNNNSYDVDVNGWVIYNSDNNKLFITSNNTNTGDTIVPAKGWLVVYRNGDSNFFLHNDGDSISLYSAYPPDDNHLIDSYTYTTTKSEGLSYARFPDGCGSWVDPIPTPGTKNQLTEKEWQKIFGNILNVTDGQCELINLTDNTTNNTTTASSSSSQEKLASSSLIIYNPGATTTASDIVINDQEDNNSTSTINEEAKNEEEIINEESLNEEKEIAEENNEEGIEAKAEDEDINSNNENEIIDKEKEEKLGDNNENETEKVNLNITNNTELSTTTPQLNASSTPNQ